MSFIRCWSGNELIMKTAISVLQEIMIKQGQIPQYEYITQTGPPHQSTFMYRCVACGVSVTASGQSKKEAKQEAARIMLLKLHESGHAVPPPFCRGGAPVHVSVSGVGNGCSSEAPASRTYVSLLNELCTEFRLLGVEYAVTGTAGPPHMPRFTIAARLGPHERTATSTSKKQARQLAAEQLYAHVKANISTVTKDCVEVPDVAPARAQEKAMERYIVSSKKPWCQNVSHSVSDQIGLVTTAEKREAALVALASSERDELGAVETLKRVAVALGMKVKRRELPADGGALTVLELIPSTPHLALMGTDLTDAAQVSLRYLRRALGAF